MPRQLAGPPPSSRNAERRPLHDSLSQQHPWSRRGNRLDPLPIDTAGRSPSTRWSAGRSAAGRTGQAVRRLRRWRRSWDDCSVWREVTHDRPMRPGPRGRGTRKQKGAQPHSRLRSLRKKTRRLPTFSLGNIIGGARLTTVFGMGTGMAKHLSSPGIRSQAAHPRTEQRLALGREVNCWNEVQGPSVALRPLIPERTRCALEGRWPSRSPD